MVKIIDDILSILKCAWKNLIDIDLNVIFPKDIKELNSFLILLLDLDLNILHMLLFKRRLSPSYIMKFISLEFQLHLEIIAITIIIQNLRTVFNLQITRSRATRGI